MDFLVVLQYISPMMMMMMMLLLLLLSNTVSASLHSLFFVLFLMVYVPVPDFATETDFVRCKPKKCGCWPDRTKRHTGHQLPRSGVLSSTVPDSTQRTGLVLILAGGFTRPIRLGPQPVHLQLQGLKTAPGPHPLALGLLTTNPLHSQAIQFCQRPYSPPK